jgi:BASS family bile acid:Na+ symporter
MLGGMDGLLDGIYLAALVVALWGTGLGLGMSHAFSELVEPLRRRGLMLRVALVDVVALPLLVWMLVRALAVPGDYAIGLLLVGVASAGPLGIKAAQIARADVPAAVALVVVLELVNLAAIPLWVMVLLPSGTEIDFVGIVRTMVVMVVLPLAVGIGIRRIAPARADRLAGAATRASDLGLRIVIVLVLVRDADAVVEAAGERVPLVAALAVLAALALGWLAGAPAPATRAAAALVTGVRANAVALAVAAASFSDRTDVRVGVVVFALFSVLVPLATATVLGRRAVASPASAVV